MVICAAENTLDASAVLSTFPRPTCALVTPDTVPVNVGELIGAFVAVRAAVSVCSLRSVWAMTPITGTSLVPVMLMVIDFVVLVPSRSVTPTV